MTGLRSAFSAKEGFCVTVVVSTSIVFVSWEPLLLLPDPSSEGRSLASACGVSELVPSAAFCNAGLLSSAMPTLFVGARGWEPGRTKRV